MARSLDDEQRGKVIAYILGEVAGGRPLTSVLIEDEGMPPKSVFWRWHMDDEELRGNLVRARENGVEAILEEARHIADTPQMGVVTTDKFMMSDGKPVPVTETRSEDMIAHRKLQIETRFKSAQMLKPKTYGAKLDLTSGGEKLGLAEAIEAGRKRVADQDGDAA